MLRNVFLVSRAALARRDGVTAVEYTVIAGVTAAAIAAAFGAFYTELQIALDGVL
ncbi:hypothetical protein [Falsiroseomonas sp.]|uniref:hypothetical protein n=1 Tax=Falsiroseomonas sp. TaxID=2870721 RepID=UPI00356A9AD4